MKRGSHTYMIHVLQQARILVQNFLFQRRHSSRCAVGQLEERVRGVVVTVGALSHRGRELSSFSTKFQVQGGKGTSSGNVWLSTEVDF